MKGKLWAARASGGNLSLGSSFEMTGMVSAERLSVAAGRRLAVNKALILTNAHGSALSADI